jgi:hypothetical protein
MTVLPTDTLAAAEFLVRHMYQPVDLGVVETRFAIAETANPIGGDRWFWSDDNAKVLEFFSRPELWHRFPAETGEILRFVRTMCRGPLIFRRVSPPRLEPLEKREGRSRYRHSLMDIEYDLSRGVVAAGLRFHDERNSENLLLTGNRVEFTHRRRHYRLEVEPAISDAHAQQQGHSLTLRHSGDLHFTSRGKPLRLGRITYNYSIDARSMFIDVEAVLEIASGVQVSDVVLTIGHDQPSGTIYYRTVDTDIGASRPLFSAGVPGWRRRDVAGASYYVIRQRHISGDSWGIHSISGDPARISALEALVYHWGRFRRVLACYSFSGSQYGTRLVARERKLITGGGFYDRIGDYRALMRKNGLLPSGHQAAWDLSTSYDYGSVINAFAKCFAVRSTRGSPEGVPDSDEIRALFDEYLNHYCDLFAAVHTKRPNAIFSRDLSFVILGLATMYKATNAADYRERLARLCEILLEFEVRFQGPSGDRASGFLMRMNSPRTPYVDCHSAALLALTQAGRYLDDARLVETIERGLASYSVESCSPTAGSQSRIDTVSTHMVDRRGTRRTQNAFWNFKAGMTLRFLGALRNSPNPSLQSLALRHGGRLERLETILRQQIARSITQREDSVEIRTAVSSGETNSETQPWVMLGLFGHPAD